MLILIVRHAQAGEQDPAKYSDDTLRPITRRGREIHEDVSAMLRRRKLVPDVVASSPWRRAWQTAQIMCQEFSGKKKMKPIEARSLIDSPDLNAIRKDLEPLDGISTVALVGHEPWLSELASLLLVGEPHRLSVDFPKSGVIGIEAAALEAGAGMLQFLVRPKLL